MDHSSSRLPEVPLEHGGSEFADDYEENSTHESILPQV
jgi:hypothetical protein